MWEGVWIQPEAGAGPGLTVFLVPRLLLLTPPCPVLCLEQRLPHGLHGGRDRDPSWGERGACGQPPAEADSGVSP